MSEHEEGIDLPDLTTEAPVSAEEDADVISASSDDETRTAADLAAVFDVPVNVSAVLGKTNIEISDLLKLDAGAIVELDRKVGEAIDIYVNDRLVARGEVVIVDEQLGVTMTEIVKGGSN
ncbi:MAG: flagellar motor switch protein FliN [Rhodobiaceae bacterium]|nr:MAG: flagellar motor switch protein FliN [Rhodobiaceae bacterium]